MRRLSHFFLFFAAFLGPVGLSAQTPKSWTEIRQDREAEIDRHLTRATDGFRWFTSAAHGLETGTPVILLRLFPELAPEIWGGSDERLARFGFFDTPATTKRPLPLGLGWVQNPVAGDKEQPKLHQATLTCAACHVGRVRVPGQKTPLILVGGPNTELDVRKFRSALHQTVDAYFTKDMIGKTTETLTKLAAQKPAGYFFGEMYGVTKEIEAAERDFFVKNAAILLLGFAQKVRIDQTVLNRQLATSYSAANAPPLKGGTPGQSDGSGDLIPRLLLARDVLAKPPADQPAALATFAATKKFPEIVNHLATATDNLSVWSQKDRTLGQLDGSVKVPMIRNIAAQVAVVGSWNKVNHVNADIVASFTSDLPSPPYPFAVDLFQAARGRTIFEKNCQNCHVANNQTVYSAGFLGVDPNRSRVQTAQTHKLFLKAFLDAIPKDFVATTPKGQPFKPWELKSEEVLNDRVHPNEQGYVAGPLDGIWARAPYLHNGSVPTLRHLLAPNNPESERPTVFLRGVVDFDPEFVGFVWRLEAKKKSAPTAAVFDTRWDGASRFGHDRDLDIDGKVLRLDFSGPHRRAELDDLLAYLKTL
jgi:hypothetical protein